MRRIAPTWWLSGVFPDQCLPPTPLMTVRTTQLQTDVSDRPPLTPESHTPVPVPTRPLTWGCAQNSASGPRIGAIASPTARVQEPSRAGMGPLSTPWWPQGLVPKGSPPSASPLFAKIPAGEQLGELVLGGAAAPLTRGWGRQGHRTRGRGSARPAARGRGCNWGWVLAGGGSPQGAGVPWALLPWAAGPGTWCGPRSPGRTSGRLSPDVSSGAGT